MLHLKKTLLKFFLKLPQETCIYNRYLEILLITNRLFFSLYFIINKMMMKVYAIIVEIIHRSMIDCVSIKHNNIRKQTKLPLLE